MLFVIYLMIGAFSGILSGLLGIGGGIIVVPALAAVFIHYDLMPSNYVMHMAIGTSLASMIITLFSALRSHVTHDAVQWSMVRLLLPWLLLGAVSGSFIAHDLPSNLLKIFFGCFLLYISYQILFVNHEDIQKPVPTLPMIRLFGVLIGIFSSVLGIGGGTMLIPFLLRCKVDLRQATGTSVACTIGIALVSTLSFMSLGLTVIHLPWSTGYIYWPAFLGIAIVSIPFAWMGTAVAYKLPASVLKRVLGIFLVLVAINMFLPVKG